MSPLPVPEPRTARPSCHQPPRHSRRISAAAAGPGRLPREETSGKKTAGDRFQALFWKQPARAALSPLSPSGSPTCPSVLQNRRLASMGPRRREGAAGERSGSCTFRPGTAPPLRDPPARAVRLHAPAPEKRGGSRRGSQPPERIVVGNGPIALSPSRRFPLRHPGSGTAEKPPVPSTLTRSDRGERKARSSERCDTARGFTRTNSCPKLLLCITEGDWTR